MSDPYLFAKMRAHWGHKIEIGLYGHPDNPVNIAVECVTCYEVICDEDGPLNQESAFGSMASASTGKPPTPTGDNP